MKISELNELKGTVGSYGVLAGSTVNAGEGNTYNGKYTTVQVDNLKINQTATGGKTNPILNNGIRAELPATLSSQQIKTRFEALQ